MVCSGQFEWRAFILPLALSPAHARAGTFSVFSRFVDTVQVHPTSSSPDGRRFEFCGDRLDSHAEEGGELDAMILSLCSFRGLKRLHLKISNFRESCQLQAVIRHHIATLKTLAYHEQQLAPIDENRLWWDTRDYAPSWIFDRAINLQLYHMTALAVCASPVFLQPTLELGAKKSKLEILHFRFMGLEHLHRDIQSEVMSQIRGCHWYCSCGCWAKIFRRSSHPDDRYGFAVKWEESLAAELIKASGRQAPVEESWMNYSEARQIVEFADWAFGPRGLPSLEVLAFGDFSYGERYQKQRFLARRRQKSVSDNARKESRITTDEESDWALCISNEESLLETSCFEDHDSFLSVCPDGGLMESPEEW
ncbi:uncharacterized protein N7483_002532 [Penicillium malachiteum]|uniref:uncharacterized protein n=1 Tax=Penicillium malachiteum TaxID=1324776 RepID=UPI002547A0C8|nr:uncharacterized protein N7483_002532 [Penicillium malachiteum]KAJ5737407.1 hypothetical protein N7483_002532 [Penicillium malachiteum]